MSMSPRFSLNRLLPLTAVWVVAVIGCGSSEVDPAASANLKALTGLYTDYAYTHNNSGPPDVEAMKKHARSMDPRSLGGVGVELSRLDEYFTSTRDKQPIQILRRARH